MIIKLAVTLCLLVNVSVNATFFTENSRGWHWYEAIVNEEED